MSSKFVKGWLVCAGAGLMIVLGVIEAAQAHNTPQEEANKKLVLDFYAALNRGDAEGNLREKIRQIAERYIAPDYLQHNEMAARAGSGREGLINSFQQMPPRQPNSNFKPAQLVTIMASGDMVTQITCREIPSAGGGPAKPLYIFNLYRIRDGKLVEHWDGSSGGVVGPPAGQSGGPTAPSAARGPGS